VLAAETLAIEFLGVRGSAFAAGLLSLAAAGVAALMAGRPGAAVERAEAPPPLAPAARRLLLAGALSGFILLGLEVICFRFLSLLGANYSTTFA